ncbi:MAG: TrgA family protein [Paracoccaceae bacterium]
MPSAARLVAALGLTLVAFIASGMIIPLLPEDTDVGYFPFVNMALGWLCGWFVMGKRAGRGVTAAINNGFTGVVSLVFWGLFVQGCNEMIRLAMRNRYSDAFESIIAIFDIMIEYGKILMDPQLIVTFIIGGVITGLITENAWRRWP